jgi:hypothetical protein
VLYRAPGDTGYLRPACTADDGKDGLLATCERSLRSVGDDTCKKGLFCSIGVGRPKDATSMHLCLPYCLTSADCDADSFCIFATVTGVTPAGYCAKRCDPFGDECAFGDSCGKFASSDPGYPWGLACSNQAGSGLTGVACGGGDCAAGFSCETLPGRSGSVCTAFCDDTHPCANGAPCLQANNADFKICGLEPVDAGADAAADAADAASD